MQSWMLCNMLQVSNSNSNNSNLLPRNNNNLVLNLKGHKWYLKAVDFFVVLGLLVVVLLVMTAAVMMKMRL